MASASTSDHQPIPSAATRSGPRLMLSSPITPLRRNARTQSRCFSRP